MLTFDVDLPELRNHHARRLVDEAGIFGRHRKLLDWHIPRCGADCCPGNDMRLAVCGPHPSIRKLENLWPAPRAKIGVVELEVCSICYHLSECHIGYEVYEDYKLAPVR